MYYIGRGLEYKGSREAGMGGGLKVERKEGWRSDVGRRKDGLLKVERKEG